MQLYQFCTRYTGHTGSILTGNTYTGSLSTGNGYTGSILTGNGYTSSLPVVMVIPVLYQPVMVTGTIPTRNGDTMRQFNYQNSNPMIQDCVNTRAD